MSPNFALILSAPAWNNSPVKKENQTAPTPRRNKGNSVPNRKTHFIAGAVVGATVNLIIQSTQMAMDYDRPFDWGEFFLCAGAGAFVSGPRLCRRPAAEMWNRETLPNLRRPDAPNPVCLLGDILQSVRNLLSAALVAWAISGKHTLKLSRPARLALWVFGMSYLSHIALDCTTPKPINLL
jgi:hypothetical protein